MDYLQHEGIKFSLRRTTYIPLWHTLATEAYGSDQYQQFVIFNGKVMEFMEFAKKAKNKMAKIGKAKKASDDV